MTPRPLSQRELNQLIDAMFLSGAEWFDARGHGTLTTLQRTKREARTVRRRLFSGLILSATPKAHRLRGARR